MMTAVSQPGGVSRERMCDGKHPHATRAEARTQANALRRAGSPGRLDTYRCPWCSQWHIGHRPPWMRRRSR